MTNKEKAMTKTPAMPTRAQMEQEAATAASRAEELQQQLLVADQQDHARRLDAQRRFDERHVAGFSRAAIEAEVDRARAELDLALAENPLVIALADYLSALRRRSHAVLEQSSALSRLGQPSGIPTAGPTELAGLEEYVVRAAERIATERIGAELAEFHARRDAAGDTTTEETR